jgi:hypothetical protein
MVLAIVLALGAGEAIAGPAVFTNPVPPPGTTISLDSFTASVDYDDVAPVKRYWAKIDGVYVTPTLTTDPGDATKGTVSFPATGLSDGPHEATVIIYNTSWKMSTYSWSFDVNTAVPPTLNTPTPEPGSEISTDLPTVSVVVGGPVVSSQLSIDGTPIPSSLAGPVLSGMPVAPIENDVTHTALAEVTGAAGSNSLSWDFYVQIHPKMPDTIGDDCETCHTDLSVHPMSDCDACHAAGSPVGMVNDPSEYVGPDEHPASWIEDLDCAYCHDPSYPAVPQVHTSPPDDPYHDTTQAACDECHQRSLTVEHYYRGNGLTCSTCHESSDPDVQNAIATGDTDCSACHEFGSGGHPYIPDAHLSDIDTDSLSGIYPSGPYGPYTCTDCHQQELSPEHVRTSSSSAPDDCDACHPTPRDTLSPWAKGCVEGGCHVVATPQEQHAQQTANHDASTESLNAKCAGSGCHVMTDLGELHLDLGCLTCHSDTVVPDTKVCEVCHADKVDGDGNVVEHGYVAADHTGTPPDATIPINSVVYGPYACMDCHELELAPEHEKTSSSSSVSDPICGACHPTPANTLVPAWDKNTCAQDGCHPAGTPQEEHGDVDAAHTRLPSNDKCSGSGCHNEDLAGTHNDSTDDCLTCHDTGVPTEKDCEVCHPDKVDGDGNVIDHGYNATTHGALVGTSTLAGTISGQSWTDNAGLTIIGGPQTYSDQMCGSCHSMDLYTEHDKPSSAGPGGCDVCHGGGNPPADSASPWDGTCSTGDCHTGQLHTQMNTKHVVADIDNSCSYCHSWGGNGFDIAGSHNDYWLYQQEGRALPNYYPPLPQNGCSIQFCHNQNATVPTGKNCDTCHSSFYWPHP